MKNNYKIEFEQLTHSLAVGQFSHPLFVTLTYSQDNIVLIYLSIQKIDATRSIKLEVKNRLLDLGLLDYYW